MNFFEDSIIVYHTLSSFMQTTPGHFVQTQLSWVREAVCMKGVSKPNIEIFDPVRQAWSYFRPWNLQSGVTHNLEAT